MGQKLRAIFDAIKQVEGVRGQMRLAMKTGITTITAKDVPDTPEKMAVFVAAYREITKQDCPISIHEET